MYRKNDDLADEIRTTFERCEYCGDLINPEGAHHVCDARRDATDVLSARTREERVTRIEADHNPPDTAVIGIPLDRDSDLQPGAYHPLGRNGDRPRPKCMAEEDVTYTDWRKFVVMTRRAAQSRGMFPCNECYPGVAERAAETYRTRSGIAAGESPLDGPGRNASGSR